MTHLLVAVLACGAPGWKELRAPIEAYCRSTKRSGCDDVVDAVRTCRFHSEMLTDGYDRIDAKPDDGSWNVTIVEAGCGGWAASIRVEKTRRRWKVSRYVYDKYVR